MKPTPRKKSPATRKPVFGDFLREQGARIDHVGELARHAQTSHFEGSTISDMWEHLDRLSIMDISIQAMTQAEQEYNVLVLDWETTLRARVNVKSVVSGGLPSLGKRR